MLFGHRCVCTMVDVSAPMVRLVRALSKGGGGGGGCKLQYTQIGKHLCKQVYSTNFITTLPKKKTHYITSMSFLDPWKFQEHFLFTNSLDF